MKAGQKVLTVDGNIETVMVVEESRIITFESARRLSWYHPTKVTKRSTPHGRKFSTGHWKA